jgi:hypothetical protein
MEERIRRHCNELERCNQRGGRMLSVFDLLNAGTLDLDLAAYLTARIARGAPFMVGANPGGAGKTTVMCALLNFVPPDTSLIAATAGAVREAHEMDEPLKCFICHEIGSGPYFGYLWGDPLRRYCALADRGHMLATNLHADDIDEAHAQVCGENRVPPKHFNAFELLVFLRVEGGWQKTNRRIETVYSSNGSDDHRPVYRHGHGWTSGDDSVDPAWLQACRSFLQTSDDGTRRTIQDTRARVLDFLAP